MKLGEHAQKGLRRGKAVEVVRPREEEQISFREVFTPTEWQKIESDVFRPNKDFSYVQDRHYLSTVSEDPKHQTEQDEELFTIGVEWLNNILHGYGKKGVDPVNFNQALYCLGVLSRALPDRRGSFPDRESIKSFVHEYSISFFRIDRHHQPKAVGLRILLRTITDYLNIFPEERGWVNEKMAEQKLEQKVQPNLEAEIAADNWREVLYLSAQARLLFPHLPITHQNNMLTYFRGLKPSHNDKLYTLLPDLLDLRIVLADEAQLGGDGLIHIVDHSPAMITPQPLPDRLVA